MNCFRLENVCFRYDKDEVLQGINLNLESGEILGLFGHNGAGKTTSIKLILGLMRPTAGKISVLGGQAGDSKVSQHVGYLPENVMFYPQLTGREILNHFARLKSASLQQVPSLLEQVGLSDAMDARTKTYSKGMRQRLGLAQALLGKPKMLILDEPTVGLDPVATADLYQLLQKLHDAGTGVVLCSHVLPGVEPYIDRAAILTDGTLRAVGNLAQLRQQARLPVTISLKPFSSVSALEKVANNAAIDIDAVVRAEKDYLHVDIQASEKIAFLKTVLGSGEVADLNIHQPSLEDIYVHFIGSGGLAHRGAK